MANMNSRNRFAVDGDLVIRQPGAAVSAATASSVVPLDVLTSYWDQGELAQAQQFAVIVVVTQAKRSAADETYDFAVQVDDNVGFASAVSVVTTRALAVGTYVIPVTRELLNIQDLAATHLRLLMTPGGTAPQVTFWAYLAPFPTEI